MNGGDTNSLCLSSLRGAHRCRPLFLPRLSGVGTRSRRPQPRDVKAGVEDGRAVLPALVHMHPSLSSGTRETQASILFEPLYFSSLFHSNLL